MHWCSQYLCKVMKHYWLSFFYFSGTEREIRLSEVAEAELRLVPLSFVFELVLKHKLTQPLMFFYKQNVKKHFWCKAFTWFIRDKKSLRDVDVGQSLLRRKATASLVFSYMLVHILSGWSEPKWGKVQLDFSSSLPPPELLLGSLPVMWRAEDCSWPYFLLPVAVISCKAYGRDL